MIDYDPHRWRELFQWKGTMVLAISRRAGLVLIAAAAIAIADHFWRPLAISAEVHALLGPALSLLLVFRTNASYDRFWEGRKLWGGIVNTSRNLARLVTVHLGSDAAMCKRALQLLAAFPYAAMNDLRGTRGIGPIEKELGEDDVRLCLQANHPPSWLMRELSAIFERAKRTGMLSDIVQMEIDTRIANHVDNIGACERIHKTPLPFAYVVHLRRALVLYCATLPFALLARFGWGAIPIAFLVATVLFGIEEIGVEIEDPFGTDDNDLPLEQICASIEKHVRSQMPTEEPAR